MPVDESFKKPGAIPFKWEIRPGVPKVQPLQQHHEEQSSDHHHPLYQQQKQHRQQKQPLSDLNHSFPDTPLKLKPPPAGFSFQPHMEPRTRSFHSAPRTRSERYRFEACDQPGFVSPGGCFPSPLLRPKKQKHKFNKSRLGFQLDNTSDLEMSSWWSVPTRKSRPELESEPDVNLDLETSSRWSVSTRKSLSPFRDSPLSYSFPLSSSFFS